jgi:hypothetical protein
MDEECKNILHKAGINFQDEEELNEMLIFRDVLMNDEKYKNMTKEIDNLKKTLSSSFLTSLQKSSIKSQKWPLLNLVRQILSCYNYAMEPIRKSDGYTLDGIKKYKRYFLIKKKIEPIITSAS